MPYVDIQESFDRYEVQAVQSARLIQVRSLPFMRRQVTHWKFPT